MARQLRPVVLRPDPKVIAGLALIAVTAVALVYAARSRTQDRAVRGERVGTAACLSCHDAQDTFTGTAHHLTSRLAGSGTIEGSFETGRNVLRTTNPYLHYRMDSTAAGFFQTAVIDGGPGGRSRSEPFHVVIGSGRKGQTYLSWADDSTLVQLPVSFWRGVGWVSSPGYREGLPNFGRPVAPRCLECHASYLERLSDDPTANTYDSARAVLGIACEVCHGAGATHVRRQGSWTRWLLGQAIVDPADLSRSRQVEACGLCHGGTGQSSAATFTYVPGDPLRDHIDIAPTTGDEAVDVHGNQLALLMASPCFRSSDMTCSTCHDVHRPQREAAAFSDRCLECHDVEHAGLPPGAVGNCVDCHMPRLPSNTILSTFEGDTLQPRVRTHLIRVYPNDAAH